MLKDLVVSKVRVKLLEIFLANPTQMYHVRDLVRRTGEEINAVRRELAHMENSGMVKKESRGNRLYYWFNKNYTLYEDLLSIISKTTGLGAQIIKNRAKLGRVSLVMLSERFAKQMPRLDPADVDLLVVGDIVLSELAAIVRSEESKREGEINYTAMTDDEFKFRRSRRDPFLQKILLGSRLMIIGSQSELAG